MINLSRFLTILFIGIKKKQLIVKVPINNIILQILWCLYKNGYVSSYHINKKNNHIEIFLKYYSNNTSIIDNIKQISKISCRIYNKYNLLIKNSHNFKNNYVITTSKGIMLVENIPYKKKIGGEVLFKIK